MTFALTRGRGIGREARRLFNKQIEGAVEILSVHPEDIGMARRRVKKAGAVLLLMRPALGHKYAAANRRLAEVRHLLAPFTEAASVIETLDRLQGYDRERLAAAAIARLRHAFVVHSRPLTTAEELHWACARAIRLLNEERERFDEMGTLPIGVHDAAAAIRRAHRAARRARREAITHPSPSGVHEWRRRIKQEWYLLRLIDREVGGGLATDTHHLEQLDGVLGTLHDVIVLQHYILTYSPLSRRDTAGALRVARAYAGEVRRRLSRLLDAPDEPPRAIEARLLSLWLSGTPLPDVTPPFARAAE
jgi:hypothetical protein